MEPRAVASPAGTAKPPAAPTGLALEIHRQAQRTPHAEAVADTGVRLDYATLDATAAAVAEALGREGVRAGQAVAVALPRSWQLVCVMLGILRLGAQVVPLDTQSPADRRRFILEDCAAAALVHAVAEAATEAPPGLKTIAVDKLLPEAPDPAATGLDAASPCPPRTPRPTCPSSSTPPVRPGGPRASRSTTLASCAWPVPATSASRPACATPAWRIRRSTR